jgi:hypothetical protein
MASRSCCRLCGRDYKKFEEKKSDVNLAMGVVDSFLRDGVDCAVIVSGDTDQVATITHVKEFFPGKKIGVLLPAYRQNQESRRAADFYINILPEHYEAHQFPNVVSLPDGKTITKPHDW